jgi:hypothetical protein
MLDHDIKNLKEGENSNTRLKVKWEKIDIDLYKALTDQSIDALNKTTRTLNDTEHLTEKICTIMNEAATKSTTVKVLVVHFPFLNTFHHLHKGRP